MTQYKDYHSGGGNFGFDLSVGSGGEMQLLKNFVHGAMIQAPTTASSQITGTGNGTYSYNIGQGIVVLDGEVLEIAAAADQLCETAANIMASGYSRYYLFIVYKNFAGTLTRLTVKGTVALTAAVVPPTVPEIEALLPADAPWLCIGGTIVNRTADTTITQSVVNQYRPMLLAKTVHEA